MHAALTVALLAFCPAAEPPREALAMKVQVDGDKASVTVGFNYVGKPGDPPTPTAARTAPSRSPKPTTESSG